MERCWSLFNRVEKLRIDELRIDQVRTILLAIPARQMPHWFACQEGDLRWANLTEITEFYEDVRAAKGESLPATQPTPAKLKEERRPLFEAAPLEAVDEATLDVEAGNTKERRSARRFVRNLIFRTKVGSKIFECQTLDVSMNGFSLKEDLPPGAEKTFKAELSLHGETVKVLVRQVSNGKFKLVEAEAWEMIKHWIVNW